LVLLAGLFFALPAQAVVYTLSLDYSGTMSTGAHGTTEIAPPGTTLNVVFAVPAILTTETTVTDFISASLGGGFSACGNITQVTIPQPPNPKFPLYASWVLVSWSGLCGADNSFIGATAWFIPTITTLGTYTAFLDRYNNVLGTLSIEEPPLTFAGGALPAGAMGSAFAEPLPVTGGTPPYTWSIISGRLPDGLSLNSATGQISGSPLNPGSSIVTIQVTDSNAPAETATAAIVLTVGTNALTIATTSLPSGEAGVPYSQNLTAMGGTGPLTWSLEPGTSLPPGLTLNSSTGQIGGTPTTAANNYRFLVRVTDSTYPTPQVASAILQLAITN
jgi:hypothetical protein